MAERVDAVVIGGGLGGLAAGVTLAGSGRTVVVLEQHTVPGGYAQCFQRGPYRFDISLHALNGLAPGGGCDRLYRDLGIWDRLRLGRLDPLYQLRLPGRVVTAHADRYRYESELIGQFPAEAAGIRGYLDEAFAAYHDSRRMEEDQAAGRMPALGDFPARYPALTRVSGETWEQMMSRHVADARVRSVLAALWGYFGLPPSRCAALTGALGTASYHEHGGWYPEGGSGALSGALAQVLRERGGQIRCGVLAAGIELNHERAVAVTTSDGQRLEAEVFISNASAPATMLEMIGRGHLPAEYAGRVAGPVPSYTIFSLYLGLNRDVFAEQGLAHELFLAGAHSAEESWQAARRGDWAKASTGVTDYTQVDPGCAPPGHAAVVVTTEASWDYQDTWGTGGDLANYQQNPRYLQIKQQTADALIARADAAVPGLAGAIEFQEASTPLTNFRYTRNPRGAIEGYENSPENTGLGWLPQQTPIRNLFLAGAWTNTGGQNPAIASGAAAAWPCNSLPRAHTLNGCLPYGGMGMPMRPSPNSGPKTATRDVRQGDRAAQDVSDEPGPPQTLHTGEVAPMPGLQIPAAPVHEPQQRRCRSAAEVVVVKRKLDRPLGVPDGAWCVAPGQRLIPLSHASPESAGLLRRPVPPQPAPDGSRHEQGYGQWPTRDAVHPGRPATRQRPPSPPGHSRGGPR